MLTITWYDQMLTIKYAARVERVSSTPTCLFNLGCCRSSNSDMIPALCLSVPITRTAMSGRKSSISFSVSSRLSSFSVSVLQKKVEAMVIQRAQRENFRIGALHTSGARGGAGGGGGGFSVTLTKWIVLLYLGGSWSKKSASKERSKHPLHKCFNANETHSNNKSCLRLFSDD